MQLTAGQTALFNPDPSPLRSALAGYGPYAFGVTSLMVVWFACVAPTLTASRVDAAALQHLADTMHTTAVLLNVAVERMDSLANRLAPRP